MLEREERGNDYENRYQMIGLTPAEYSLAVKALTAGDYRTLVTLTRASQRRMLESEQTFSPTTREQYFNERNASYRDDRSILHDSIIAEALKEGAPVDQPVLTFLAGPPGVGKSLYKTKWFPRTGIVETDPDAVKEKLLPGYDGLNLSHVRQTHDESLDIAQMVLDRALQERLSVVCETTLRNLPWMHSVLEKAGVTAYKSEIIFLHKPFSACFQDAFERSERPISLQTLLSSVHGYDNLLILGENEAIDSIEVIDMSHARSGQLMQIAPNKDALDNQEMETIFNSLTPYRQVLASL